MMAERRMAIGSGGLGLAYGQAAEIPWPFSVARAVGRDQQGVDFM